MGRKDFIPVAPLAGGLALYVAGNSGGLYTGAHPSSLLLSVRTDDLHAAASIRLLQQCRQAQVRFKCSEVPLV